MARLCTVCTAPRASDINARLASGASISSVATEFSNIETSLSESSLRRHVANHLPRVRLDATDANTTAATDLLDRLQQALEDVDRIRTTALASGRGELVVKAALASAKLIDTLTVRLGIDDLEVARFVRDGQNLAQAIGLATRKHPAIGRAVSQQLTTLNPSDTTTPAALEALAVSSAEKLKIQREESTHE